jgi:hypothetical protein
MKIFCQVGDVVQFTENHKWRGCLGIVSEIKDCGDDIRYLIGVPIPNNDGSVTSTAYIFSMLSENDFEFVGRAVLA